MSSSLNQLTSRRLVLAGIETICKRKSVLAAIVLSGGYIVLEFNQTLPTVILSLNRDGGSESALRTRREERSEGVLVQPATASDCTRGHTHHVLRVRDCMLRQTRLAA